MHGVHAPGFLPPSMFVTQPSDDIGAMMNGFASLVLDGQSSATLLRASSGQDTHAFSILARVLKDPTLASKGPRQITGQYPDTLVARGYRIREHVQKWTVDLSRPGEIERKMEECIWTSSVIYALSGWRNGFTEILGCIWSLQVSSSLHSSHTYLLEHKPYFSAHTFQALLHGSWHAADPPWILSPSLSRCPQCRTLQAAPLSRQ